jgi:hypothetical protein
MFSVQQITQKETTEKETRVEKKKVKLYNKGTGGVAIKGAVRVN